MILNLTILKSNSTTDEDTTLCSIQVLSDWETPSYILVRSLPFKVWPLKRTMW